MFLQYEGAGRLHGFPEFCINKATGKKADCSANTEWMPDVSIPVGGSVKTLDGATEYAVKASDYKILFQTETGTTPCTNAGLSTTTVPDLPDESQYVLPDHNGLDNPATADTLVRVVSGVCAFESDCA